MGSHHHCFLCGSSFLLGRDLCIYKTCRESSHQVKAEEIKKRVWFACVVSFFIGAVLTFVISHGAEILSLIPWGN